MINEMESSIYTHTTMKKSELTQLTQIVELLVTKEIRKQLPQLIGEVFSNMAGKSMVSENIQPVQKEVELPPVSEHLAMTNSLRELFMGATPVTKASLDEGKLPASRPIIQYTKDPILNQVLNATTPDLKQREGMMSMAAIQAGHGTPGMPTAPHSQSTPDVIQENHIPLADIADGVSALDVARAGMVLAPITEALTNYDRMKKILTASKGKRY